MKLVIADDHKGLRAAARRVFSATQQRCRVHWMRNALAHAPAKSRTAVAAMLKTIFARGKPRPRRRPSGTPSPMRSERSRTSSAPSWTPPATTCRPAWGSARSCLELSTGQFAARRAVRRELPREHWTQIAGTNPLERVNREIKRRADVIGVRRCHRCSNRWRLDGNPLEPVAGRASLPNDDAIIVPGAFAAPPGPRSPFTVGALMPETNDEWIVARRYMSPDTNGPGG